MRTIRIRNVKYWVSREHRWALLYIPPWALALTIRQGQRVNYPGHIAWSWRMNGLIRQNQQRRIIRKMKRVLCH